jgi:hypothetical protein
MLKVNGPNQTDESSKLKWPSRIIVIIFYPHTHSSLLDITLPGPSLIPVSPETEQSILLTRVDEISSLYSAFTVIECAAQLFFFSNFN